MKKLNFVHNSYCYKILRVLHTWFLTAVLLLGPLQKCFNLCYTVIDFHNNVNYCLVGYGWWLHSKEWRKQMIISEVTKWSQLFNLISCVLLFVIPFSWLTRMTYISDRDCTRHTLMNPKGREPVTTPFASWMLTVAACLILLIFL